MYPYPINNTPYAGVGAVNIQIYNPSVNAPAGMPNPNQGQMSVPVQQVPVRVQNAPQPAAITPPPVNTTPAVTGLLNNNQPVATEPLKENKSAEKRKKEIVQLTDDYIKTLETYLRNQNAEVRLMGAKELMQRFKEEKTRKNDAALNSLLNLTLQDPSSNVRFLGLSMLDCGYAQGDNKTIELLKQIQKTDNVYNQDATLASEALLKMAGKKISVTTDEVEEKHEKKKTGNKLDLVSK